MVNKVLALLKIDVKSLISAANITDSITPRKPTNSSSNQIIKNNMQVQIIFLENLMK